MNDHGSSGFPGDILSPTDAAKVLGLSSDMVRTLSDMGKLAVSRTVSGRRFYLRSDVDRLAAERSKAGR